MNKLRIVIIGAGHLGKIHARLAKQNPDIQLVAVADPYPDARESVAEENEIGAVEDYRSLIGTVDAAIVAAPTTAHHAIGMDLIASGIPTFIEKPLASTYSEAKELADFAKARGVTLQVGHVERFNPAFSTTAKDISDPKFITAERYSGYPGRSLDIGVVLDLMIHDIDLTLALAQSPLRAVEAMGVSVLGGHEDMATARLSFESGCIANLTACRVSSERKRLMQVFSARAQASLDFATGQATVIQPREDLLRRTFNAPSLPLNELADVQNNLFEKYLIRSDRKSESVNAIAEEQRDFVRAILTGKEPLVNGIAGCNALAVAEAILESIKNHEWDGNSLGRRGPMIMPALPLLRPAAA